MSERSCHCDYDCGSTRSYTVSISWCKSVPGPPELSCGGHLSGFDDHHLCVVSKTSWVYTLSTDMWSDHLGWEEGLWRGTQAGCNDHCLTPQPTLDLSCPQKMRFRITFSNPPKNLKYCHIHKSVFIFSTFKMKKKWKYFAWFASVPLHLWGSSRMYSEKVGCLVEDIL